MDWDDDRAYDEFRRLRLMASLKYDGYRDFEAGVRFIESLAAWLQQFKPNERSTAYEFVTDRLVYIGPGEMEKLVAQFYTNWVRPELVRAVAEELQIRPYLVNADADALDRIAHLRRRTLFLGLSDGARVDYLRHQNVGLISNEQVVGSAQLDSEKWQDLLGSLRKDTDDPDARFVAVYLVDDFVATGTTFFRIDSDTGAPKGKLVKFAKSVRKAVSDLERQIFEEDYRVNVHHYAGTAAAISGLGARIQDSAALLTELGISSLPRLTYGIKLPESLPMSASNPEDQDFLELANRYYDPVLETSHTKVGGTDDMKLGYGGCALPLVLDHNTPNNSLPLLWAETNGADGDAPENSVPAMRPLFRRRQRHT
ncbi:hypothetical protein [Mycobacterium sp. 1164966.3]|uniref:phosphoribosyltransferase-like protein n=1 Tax=Mycobacterium sp. 1164966.3 TaxID=1856861 RepID=UPI000A3DA6B1|nr:hypothetical protein [Mycobacterium sp. 1164966.3]